MTKFSDPPPREAAAMLTEAGIGIDYPGSVGFSVAGGELLIDRESGHWRLFLDPVDRPADTATDDTHEGGTQRRV